MTPSIPPRLRAIVVARAEGCCEYYRLSQHGQEATFHVDTDHVIPRVLRGATDEANLALACVGCSLHKAARHEAIDAESNTVVPLFNPRTQLWSDHFAVDGAWVRGSTPVGRVTVESLAMNRQLLLEARKAQAELRRRSTSD